MSMLQVSWHDRHRLEPFRHAFTLHERHFLSFYIDNYDKLQVFFLIEKFNLSSNAIVDFLWILQCNSSMDHSNQPTQENIH